MPRRPLKSRETRWARVLASALARAGVSPNAISVGGLAFAFIAALCLWKTSDAFPTARIWWFFAAAGCIQLRLLCNLLDGMVAIEGGRKTAYGELLNEMPDRFGDLAILVAAGYALTAVTWGRDLGWLAGALALLTAYVRVLGGSMGLPQAFAGPMAKQHRMAVLTVACVASVFEPALGWHGASLTAALFVVVVGSALTIVRRTAAIAAQLKER